jgi:hypothetical protein
LVVDLKTFETWSKEKQDKFMELAYQIDEDHLEGFHGKKSFSNNNRFFC